MMQQEALEKLRKISPFCHGFVQGALAEGHTAKEISQLITKSAALDPSLAELWNAVLVKMGAAPLFTGLSQAGPPVPNPPSGVVPHQPAPAGGLGLNAPPAPPAPTPPPVAPGLPPTVPMPS